VFDISLGLPRGRERLFQTRGLKLGSSPTAEGTSRREGSWPLSDGLFGTLKGLESRSRTGGIASCLASVYISATTLMLFHQFWRSSFPHALWP
jgi:hypothetical protein